MVNLKATCLVCVDENEEPRDFEVSEKEIRVALLYAQETGGKALIACGYCGTVYALPSDLSTGNLKEWIIKQEAEEASCCPCMPLKGIVAVEPAARNELPPKSGRIFYKPGGAQEDPDYPDGFPRRIYMSKFALCPVVAWRLMHTKPIKPKVIP